MNKHYEIYKITETTGCVYEDGADTRKTTIRFELVSRDEEEAFLESLADSAGYQDYSYNFDSQVVLELWEEELEAMKDLFTDLKRREE